MEKKESLHEWFWLILKLILILPFAAVPIAWVLGTIAFFVYMFLALAGIITL